MLTKEEGALVLSLAEKAGYRGYTAGNFYVYSSKTMSGPALLKKLGMPEMLDVDGGHRIMAKFKDESPYLVDLLKNVPYVPEQFDNNIVPGIGDTTEGIEQEKAIQEDYSIFKTVRTEAANDPGSAKAGGLSILAFNKKSRILLNGNNVSIDGILTILGTNREDAALSPNVPHVWPDFNPYTTALTFKKKIPVLGDRLVTCLNTAIPPRWMTHRSKDVVPKYGGFIKKLVEHLFPDEHERERVLDWCYYAIFKRNGTVLCLAGDRGTGKSTFIEILGELVGSEYTELVSESILKERFNAQFKNKRLIVFEEVALENQTAVNKVKAWCNAKISIEEKGQDPFSADNFSSMVFLLNDLNDLRVLPQERRFSIPVVAEENLLTAISEEEISKVKEGIANSSPEALDMIAEFGEYLKLRGKPKLTEYVPIKGYNFNRVSDLSLTEWQSHLRDFVQSHGEIGQILPITVIFPHARLSEKGDTMKYPTKKPTIDNFLRDYRFLGKYKIGDLVDIKEAEMQEIETKFGIQPGRATGGRTRRLYGIKPKADFLKACGLKYQKPEDLL